MVSILDIGRGQIVSEIPVGVEPEGMGVSPDGRTLVNTSETTSMAHFIDTQTHEVVANVLVDSRPRVARWSHDGKRVWVSSEVGGTVAVIDADQHKVLHKISFAIPGVATDAIQAVGVLLTDDDKLAFVALGPANRVAVVDGQTFEVKKYLLVGQRVWNLAFSLDKQRIYTTNGLSNDISIIDVPSLKVIKSVPVGQAPWGVAVAP
jgi:PQQ-dependent catabolism-associated beta-propeller protein